MNRERRFIPILLDDCVLPETLRIYKYIDLRRRSGKAYRELLAAIAPSEEVKSTSPRRSERTRPANQILIHHIEDEPELVRWIPSVLHHRLLMTGDVNEVANYDDAEQRVEFTVSRRGVETLVVYRWHRSVRDFEEAFIRSRRAQQIIISDMMIEANGGTFTNLGLEALRLASPYIQRDERFILSAYPRSITEPVCRLVEPTQIFFKPADTTVLISKLIRRMRRWL